MHDISVAQAFMDSILETLEGRKPREIKLKLAVGKLRFVEPAHIKQLLAEMMTSKFGESLKVKISVQTIEPEIECRCGFRGKASRIKTTHEMAHMGIFEMHCPNCRGDEFDVVKGRECLLLEIKAKE